MTESQIKELKRSDILKIEAAIVEIVENANFDLNENDNVDIVRKGNGELMMMTFERKSISLDDLLKIKTELNGDFTISISPRGKTSVNVTIEAKEEEFIKILENKFT